MSSSAHHKIDTKQKKKTPEPDKGEEEFQIAADLTLYANPLRCLAKRSGPVQGPMKREEAADAKDIIAADLTKYGSPLDDKN